MTTLRAEGSHSFSSSSWGKTEEDGLSVPFYLSALKNNPDSEKVEHIIVVYNTGLGRLLLLYKINK